MIIGLVKSKRLSILTLHVVSIIPNIISMRCLHAALAVSANISATLPVSPTINYFVPELLCGFSRITAFLVALKAAQLTAWKKAHFKLWNSATHRCTAPTPTETSQWIHLNHALTQNHLYLFQNQNFHEDPSPVSRSTPCLRACAAD